MKVDIIQSTESEKPPKIYCKSCKVTFSKKSEFKKHFQMNWHRFNFKRNMLGLSPLSEVEFERKRKILAEKKRKLKEEEEKEKVFWCKVCNKKFKSEKTKEHHDQSRKHIKNVAKQKKLLAFKKKGKAGEGAYQLIQGETLPVDPGKNFYLFRFGRYVN